MCVGMDSEGRPEGCGWTLCGTIVSLGSGPDHTRDTCSLSGNKTHTSGSKRDVNIATRAPGGRGKFLGGSEGPTPGSAMHFAVLGLPGTHMW